MAISDDDVYRLDHQSFGVLNKVGLGTLIRAAEQVVAGEIALADGKLLVGNGSGIAAAQTPSGDVTITNAGVTAIGAAKVLLAMLGAGVTPSHVVKFAGKYTTLGGSATEAQTVTGVAATDVVVATLQAKGATPRTILTAAPTLNTLTYVFSGDPSTDHTVSYVVYRAAT